MSAENKSPEFYGKIVLYAILAFVAYKLASALLGMITGLTDTLTIGKSGEDERNAAEGTANSPAKLEAVKYFNPTYGFKKVVSKYGKSMDKYYVGKLGFSNDDANKIAKQLYDAHGVFNDDEQVVYSALNQIPSLCALSLVSFRFSYYNKGKNLLPYLGTFLDGKELDTAIYTLSKKPVY